MLTQDILMQHLHYNPETGDFTRLIKLHGKAASGYVNTDGYVRIRVLREKYAAHRIAWMYVYGEWPSGPLDHINGEKTDNRIANLRITNPVLNNQNKRKAMSTNKSGLLGAHYTPDPKRRKKPYRSCRGGAGNSIYLGYFATAEEAHEAYKQAKRKYHEACTI